MVNIMKIESSNAFQCNCFFFKIIFLSTLPDSVDESDGDLDILVDWCNAASEVDAVALDSSAIVADAVTSVGSHTHVYKAFLSLLKTVYFRWKNWSFHFRMTP